MPRIASVCESLETRRLFAATLVHQELHRPPRGIADINGDGLDDLVVATSEARGAGAAVLGFDTYLNDGKGNMVFATHTDCDDSAAIGPSAIPHAIVIADLDGDGGLDVVMKITVPSMPADPSVPHHRSVATFAGDGTGGFAQRQSFILPHVLETSGGRYNSDPYAEDATRGIAVGDLDGDGLADLVSWEGSHLVAALSQGKGIIGRPFVLDGTRSQDDGIVGLADLDGDGRADILMSIDDGLWYLHYEFTTGRPQPGTLNKIEGITLKQTTQVRLGDLDGDGHTDDLIVFNGQQVTFGINSQTGGSDGKAAHSFTWKQLDGPFKFSTREVLIGDLDGDGRDDLFTLTYNGHPTILKAIARA